MADSSGDDTALSGTPTGKDSILVTIIVTNVDEKPMFSVPAEGVRTTEHAEGLTALGTSIATYTAADPEGGVVTLSLSGDDMGKFKLDELTSP